MISNIRSKAENQSLIGLINYFELKVVPAIKQKFPENHEENML